MPISKLKSTLEAIEKVRVFCRRYCDVLFRPVVLARIFFILLCTWMAALLAWDAQLDPRPVSIIGLIASVLVVLIEHASHAVSSRKIVLAVMGWFLGLVFAQLFYPSFGWLLKMFVRFTDVYFIRNLNNATAAPFSRIVVSPETARFICHIMFGYFGLLLALRHSDWLRLANLKLYLANPTDRPKILDSSVIIDGRIVDMIGLGLFQGPITVPAFVLAEIQLLADAGDTQRRARGKRGMEVLDKLRTRCPTLDIVETDYADIPEVDQKLIRLCRDSNAELVTNDYNLQKLAQLRQIGTLNLHELADAMKPTVYVGEVMTLKIVKPGKEPEQGVGYLEDGTMVVVDGAERLVGRDSDIIISSILQNPTGRLIFARRLSEDREINHHDHAVAGKR